MTVQGAEKLQPIRSCPSPAAVWWGVCNVVGSVQGCLMQHWNPIRHTSLQASSTAKGASDSSQCELQYWFYFLRSRNSLRLLGADPETELSTCHGILYTVSFLSLNLPLFPQCGWNLICRKVYSSTGHVRMVHQFVCCQEKNQGVGTQKSQDRDK